MFMLSTLLVLAIAHADDRQGWTVDQWDMRDGLPQNSVTDIHQSQDGYIWLTTFGGIARFDGREFRSFQPWNTPGLGARFTSVEETPDGVLWFGSEDQGLFRLQDGSLEQISDPMRIWDLAVGDDGTLWIAGVDGVYRHHDTLEKVDGFDGVVNLTNIGDAIVGHAPRGKAFCVDGNCPDIEQGPSPSGVDHWYETTDGSLIATSGLLVFRHTGREWVLEVEGPQSSSFPLTCALYLEEIWCAQTAAPFSLDAPVWENTEEAPVRVMYPDRSGGLWVGTDGAGLYYYRPRMVTTYPGRGTTHVVGHPTGGIWYSGSSKTSVHDAPAPPWGTDRGAILWMANEDTVHAMTGQTLYTVNADNVTEQPVSVTRVQRPVEGPCFADNNTLFTVSEQGNVQEVVSAASLNGQRLEPLRCAENGEQWVVIDRRFLVQLRSQQEVMRVDLEETLQIRDVYTSGEWIWAATYGMGLVAIRDGAVQRMLMPSEGMCDDMISRIYDTNDGFLWFSTNYGLGRVALRNLEQAATGGSVRCALVDSGEANGNGGFLGKDGRLWVTTIHGVSVVKSERLGGQQVPLMYLDSVRYNNVELEPDAVVEGDGTLDIYFVGLYYQDPHAVLYRYRMLGISDEWSEISVVNRVRYPSLSPGEYTFEVQARGRDGLWSPVSAFSFTRTPTFAERPLVRTGIPLLLVGMISGGLLLGLRSSIRSNRRLAEEIAERMRAEKALQQQQAEVELARRSREAGQRLEAIGRLSAGMAHDFNNLMTVVSVHAVILTDHEDEEVQEEARGLLEVVERASLLTRELLVFGRQQTSQAQVLDLGASLNRLVPMLHRLIRADIQLTVEQERPCGVRIDPGRLDQIVTNLILNARDAIAGEGHIGIFIRQVDTMAELRIEDDGVGMEPDVVEHIFEPYFTTRALGEGTGLGMATVHGAVQEVEGTISVTSTPGQGTTVCIRFPLHPLVLSAQTATVPRTPSATDLRVLIVDDRSEVLRAVKELTTRIGWDVMTANNLDEAVLLSCDHTFDLLLTDVVMPNGDGRAVRRAVRTIQPNLPTVFMTGYTDLRADLESGEVVLTKPFSREELLDAVAQVLNKEDAIRA